MKLSIRGRVLFLALSSVVAALLAVGVVAVHWFYVTRGVILQQEDVLAETLAESMGNYAAESVKDKLKKVTEAKAQHLDREFHIVGEDVEFMADCMTRILSFPENYLPRALPNTRLEPDILAGVPYIHYSPELMRQGIGEETREEIGRAGNIADVLVPMSKSYDDYRTSFFAGSKNGYMVCVDIVPSKDGTASIYPSEEARQEFLESFDPRERFWYRLGKDAAKPVFTSLFIGAEGLLDISCVMPYYDNDGFAGVTGISYSVEDIHRTVVESAHEESSTNFILDGTGDVVISSEKDGILAAVPENVDLRQAAEPDIAEAVKRMTAGESGVMSVALNGKDYYLAFAPMETAGWSYGVLIEDKEVADAVTQVSGDVLQEMGMIRNTLREIFSDSLVKMGTVLLPVLLLVIYGSGFMAARVTRPIRRLADGVKEIAAGNFDRKLDLSTGDEIEHLAECFNSMTEELKTYTQHLAQAAAEKEHARTELEVAAKIQTDMLPNASGAFPERKEFELYALMEPAKDVGGDFYDFYMLDERRLAFAIADVSGKGIPAAMFMAKSQSILKHCLLTAKSPDDLASVLEHANRLLCKNNEAAMFVTVFLGILNLETGRLTYADGGHCPPLFGRDGSYAFLPMKKGTMLGLMELPYEQQSVELLPGDVLYLYTDGVSEAMNEAEAQFTEARIKEALDALPPDRKAEDILPYMLERVRQHIGEAEQSDDITMLSLQYHGNNHK